jgi:hypothetical protein
MNCDCEVLFNEITVVMKNSFEKLPITTIFESALQLEPENRIPLYIHLPDRDCQNQQFDNTEHRDKFTQQFTLWFGGCSIDQKLGFWQGQAFVCENTHVLMSYVTYEQLIENMHGLKTILDDFYYRTNQETLLLVLGNRVYFYQPSSFNFDID